MKERKAGKIAVYEGRDTHKELGMPNTSWTDGDNTKFSLGNYVKNTRQVVLARTQLMREAAFRWIFAPLLYMIVLTSLSLFALDALGIISPMRDGLLSVIKVVLGSALAACGVLFNRNSSR